MLKNSSSEYFRHQDSNARKKFMNFLPEYSTRGLSFRLESWQRQLSFYYLKKKQVQMTSQVNQINTCWTFRTVLKTTHGPKQNYAISILLNKKTFGRDIGWRKHRCSYWEIRVWITRQIKSNKLLWSFWLSGLRWKDQNNGFPIKSSYAIVEFWNVSLMEKLNLKFVEKKFFVHR